MDKKLSYKMNEEILGGLKAALARGESLKKAMMSFYSAGYKKEDIEAAARALYEQGEQPIQPRMAQPAKQIQKPIQKIKSKLQKKQPAKQIQQQTQQVRPKPPKSIQRVSNYEQTKPKRKWLLFFMIFFLILLLGILAGIYFFKQEIMDLFSNLF